MRCNSLLKFFKCWTHFFFWLMCSNIKIFCWSLHYFAYIWWLFFRQLLFLLWFTATTACFSTMYLLDVLLMQIFILFRWHTLATEWSKNFCNSSTIFAWLQQIFSLANMPYQAKCAFQVDIFEAMYSIVAAVIELTDY